MSDWKSELEEAKELFEAGIISEADFDELKSEVLKKRDSLISYGVIDETSAAGESDLVEMVLIPAGEFMMGALPNDEEADDKEKPRHKVEITKDFYVGKYPVTQELWESVMGSNPSSLKSVFHPVETVSWFDCVAFCNKLSEQEGKQPAYTIDGKNVTCNWNVKGYRLLSEAEWEYCARANQTFLYSGSNNLDEVGWYCDNSGRQTHPVGQKKANGFGLYDMSGNVEEWVWDWFGGYSTENQSDPTGAPTGSLRGYRGSSWDYDPWRLRVSFRYGNRPRARGSDLGFRLGLPR